MKEFAMLFRESEIDNSHLTSEQLNARIKRWEDWFGGIAAQGRLSSIGNRLDFDGKVLKRGGVITDGPFVEIKEILRGIIIVKAESLDDAITLAHGCPAIDAGGCVEVRPLLATPKMKI